MDLSNLKNMNVSDLMSSLKGSELLKDKKFLINFGVGFGAILFFLIGYYFFVSPTLKDQKEKITDRIAMKRWGTPEDIAGAAVYLASDRASYTTGTTITVDGGYSIT